MFLQLSTWPEIEAYLKTNKSIIIPIGSTEQHGPTGLIGTDAICPQTLAQGIEKQCQALIAPTINFGMAQHHLGFPGTISLRPSTLMALIFDIVNSLAVHGFEKIYFLNGHGGNVATLEAAFDSIYAESSFKSTSIFSKLECRLHNWWEHRELKNLSKELHGENEGWHATPGEIALTYFAYPHAVKSATLHPQIAPIGEFRDASDFRQQFPDGRIGSDPSKASVATGEKLYQIAVACVLKDYLDFVNNA
ncbi:MAG TPA: creatininase family protein [Gammaproteobacteria bacterium]|nr:creatininase family protein [Gammaproteobacteria bacterium]